MAKTTAVVAKARIVETFVLDGRMMQASARICVPDVAQLDAVGWTPLQAITRAENAIVGIVRAKVRREPDFAPTFLIFLR